jgi:DNA-binding HxlR family transcriptional regulator
LPRHPKSRSECPVSISLDQIGDRWSLLIVRDIMVRSFSTFTQFQSSDERMASNILADRLLKLRRAGILAAQRSGDDGRTVHYRLTKKGIDLAPLLLELLIWGARNGGDRGTGAVIRYMEHNREQMLAEVRRRWLEKDPQPLQVNGRWALKELKNRNSARPPVARAHRATLSS